MLAPVSEGVGKMLPVGFDDVLAILHGWLGERVGVGVDVTVRPLTLVQVRGVLGAGDDIADPQDEDEFTFRVGEEGALALRRDHFHDADLFPSAGQLRIALLENPEARHDHVTAVVEIVGPPFASLRAA